MLLSFDRVLTLFEASFVRPVDDGLSYASIYPFADEWKRTFSPVIPEDRHLELPLPVHFWFRCVDGIARIYFSLEDTHTKPTNNQPQGTEIRGNLLHIMQSTIKLKLDSVETRYNVWNGGADVQIDVRQKPYRSVLRVQINNWTPYTAFPMDRCVRSSHSSNHHHHHHHHHHQQGSHGPTNAAASSSSSSASSAFWLNHNTSTPYTSGIWRSSDTVQTVLGLSGMEHPLLTQQQFLSHTHSNNNKTISNTNHNRNVVSSSSGSSDIVVHVHTFDQFIKGRHPRMQVNGSLH